MVKLFEYRNKFFCFQIKIGMNFYKKSNLGC